MSAVRVALCLQLALLVAAAAEAQTTPAKRSTRGLFGRQDDQPRRPQTIDFTMTLSEGYDNTGNDQLAAGPLDASYRHTGVYSNLDAGFRYTRIRRERRLTVTTGSALRYYPAPYRLVLPNYQGALAFTSPLWRTGRLNVNQDFGYTPSYQLELFRTPMPDATQMPSVDASNSANWKQPAYAFASGIQFVQTLSARSRLELAYDRRSVILSGVANDLTTEGGGIKFTHHLRRYAGFHAGIGSRVGAHIGSAVPNRVRTHDIDIGFDYDRPLSLARRTTLSVSSGSSLVPQDGRTYYRVTGNVSLAYQMGRTWTASLRYDRELQFIEAFPRPFFSDAIAVRLKSNPARRVDLQLSAAYSAGAIGVAGNDTGVETYTGTAKVGISVNRHVALFSEYLYYHYRLGQQTLAAAFPAHLDRQTARIGLKLWFPFD
jgi:hypothetical protein